MIEVHNLRYTATGRATAGPKVDDDFRAVCYVVEVWTRNDDFSYSVTGTEEFATWGEALTAWEKK